MNLPPTEILRGALRVLYVSAYTTRNWTLSDEVSREQINDLYAAHIARGKLEAEGIDAQVRDDHLIGMNWLYSTAVGGAKVVVADADYERARSILAGADDSASAASAV